MPRPIGTSVHGVSGSKGPQHILEQRKISPGVKKWVTKLMEYNFEILYRAGPKNKAADALSRMLSEAQLNVIAVPSLVDLSTVDREVQDDEKLKNIFDKVI